MRVVAVIAVVFLSACEAIPRRIIHTQNAYSVQHEDLFSDERKGSLTVLAPVPSPGNKESRQLDKKEKTETEGEMDKDKTTTTTTKDKKETQKIDKTEKTTEKKPTKDKTKSTKDKKKPTTKKPQKKCDKKKNPECEYYQCKNEDVSEDTTTTTKRVLVPFTYKINRKRDSQKNIDEIIHKVEKHVPRMLQKELCSKAQNRYLRVDNNPINFAGVNKDLMDGIDSLPLDIRSDSENCTSSSKGNECVVVDGSLTLFYTDTNTTVNSTESDVMYEGSLMETTHQLIEEDMKKGTLNLMSEDGANVSYIPYRTKSGDNTESTVPENNKGNSVPEENEKSFGVAIGTICGMVAVVAGFIGYKIYEKRRESSDYMFAETPIAEAYVVDEVDQKAKSVSH